MVLSPLVTLALALVLAVPTQQEGDPPPQERAASGESSEERASPRGGSGDAAEDQKEAKDPFRPDERVRRILTGGECEDDFVPLEGGVALPAMKMQGLLKVKGRKTAASVHVDGIGSFVVRQGEKLVFSLAGRVVAPRRGGGEPAAVEMREQIPIALLVQEISRDGVVVEVGTLGETLIIR